MHIIINLIVLISFFIKLLLIKKIYRINLDYNIFNQRYLINFNSDKICKKYKVYYSFL